MNNDMNNGMNYNNPQPPVQPPVNEQPVQPQYNMPEQPVQQPQPVAPQPAPAEPKKDNKKLFIIGGVVLVVLIVLFLGSKLLKGGSSNISGSTTVKYGAEELVKGKDTQYKVKVLEVKKNEKYESESLFGENGTFTLVKLQVQNVNSEEVDFILTTYKLLDSSKNEISSCDLKRLSMDSKVEGERLPSTIAASSSGSGYVYCETDSAQGAYLMIKEIAYTSTTEKSDSTLKLDGKTYYMHYNTYYFELS